MTTTTKETAALITVITCLVVYHVWLYIFVSFIHSQITNFLFPFSVRITWVQQCIKRNIQCKDWKSYSEGSLCPGNNQRAHSMTPGVTVVVHSLVQRCKVVGKYFSVCFRCPREGWDWRGDSRRNKAGAKTTGRALKRIWNCRLSSE